MSLESLKLVRNLLIRTALVSLILTWVLAAITVALWDFWSGLTSQLFRTPVADLGLLISYWFALIKFYMLFLLLAPALALHWEIKAREKQAGAS